MDPPAVLERLLQRPLVVEVRQVLDTYGKGPGGLLANGLAFSTLFATFPIALLILGVAGLFATDPDAQQRIADALKELIPPLSELVDSALAAVTAGAAAASILGFVGVLWTVSQFYATLDLAFSRIFDDRPGRDMVNRTLRGLLLVVGIIVVVISLFIVGALAALFRALLPDELATLEVAGDVISSWPFLLGLGVVATAMVYRVVPAGTPRWRSIWLPAILVGVVVVVLSQVFLRLVPLLVGAAAVAGSLATAFIALAWLSFTFQAVLYGAAWVRVRDDKSRGVPVVPPGTVAAAGSALAGPAAPAEPGVGRE
jgi:membrane protein